MMGFIKLGQSLGGELLIHVRNAQIIGARCFQICF
jgi:hypothetical protein